VLPLPLSSSSESSLLTGTVDTAALAALFFDNFLYFYIVGSVN